MARSSISARSAGWRRKPAFRFTRPRRATHGMTRSFARELGQYNIRVNTVVPGWVMTKRQLDLWVDDAANELIDRSQCLAGRVQPDDIAAKRTAALALLCLAVALSPASDGRTQELAGPAETALKALLA